MINNLWKQEIIKYLNYLYQSKYPIRLFILGGILSLFQIKVSPDAWFTTLSTIAQVFGALIALVAMFLLYRLEVLENKLISAYNELNGVDINDWIKLKNESKQYSEEVDEIKDRKYLKLLSDDKKYEEANQTIQRTTNYLNSTGFPIVNSFIDEHSIYVKLSDITLKISKQKNYKKLLCYIIPKLRRFVYLIIICIIFLSIGSIQITYAKDWLLEIIMILSNFKLPFLGAVIGIAVSELLEFIKTINDMVVKYE